MKKICCILILSVSVAFAIWGVGYVKKSGLLKAYPDAVYMQETENRIAYQNLNDTEKAVYTALYNGISQKSEYIDLPYEVDGDTYRKIYCNIEKQEPEFFYLSSDFYTAEKIRTAQIIYRDDINTDIEKENLQNECDKIISQISGDNFQKALYIHDYLAKNCTYLETGEEYLDTVYGCIVENSANCEGYAKSFKYLCDNANIPCVVVVGQSYDGTNHAWNQVRIDGDWYNVDVTWDDTDDEFELVHTYFLENDDGFQTHYADSELMPVFECNQTSQNYYVKNQKIIETQDDAETILAGDLTDISENIELKFSNSHNYSEFKNVYMTNRRVFDILMENNFSIGENGVRCLMKEFENNNVIVLRFLPQ